MQDQDDSKPVASDQAAAIHPFSGQPLAIDLLDPFKGSATPTPAAAAMPEGAPTPGTNRAAGAIARIVASTARAVRDPGAHPSHPARDRDALPEALPPRIRRILETPLSVFEALKDEQAVPGTQPLTYVGFVLDRSSSMQTGKAETIAGFNAQVEAIKTETATAGETRLGMVVFADKTDIPYMGQGVAALTPLTEDNYKPGGCTALFDGVGVMIAELLAQPQLESPETAVLVTLFTDGEENASRLYTPTVLKALISRLEATGRWTFALVGPGTTAMALADLLAVDRSNVAGFDPDSVDSRSDVMISMKLASSAFMRKRSGGQKSSKGLYKDDKQP